jgi:hypothetical protein
MSAVKKRKQEESAGPVETTGSGVWHAGHKVDLKTMQVQASRLNCREKMLPARTPEATVEWLEVKEERASGRPGDGVETSPAIEVRVGRYVVNVASGFDKTAFSDVCRVLTGLCQC